MTQSDKQSLNRSNLADGTPVAIGGMGGSGTRLIAQIVETLGYHLGSELNKAKDNLLFTLLFKRISILREPPQTINKYIDILLKTQRNDTALSNEELMIFEKLALKSRPFHKASWLSDIAQSFQNSSIGKRHNLIAWKEPNTHILLENLMDHPAGITYLHVMRDGLDMSFSANQHQLKLWGETYLKRPVENRPVDALDYWIAIHLRVFSCKLKYPDRIEIVSFDKICQHDEKEIQKISQFVGIEPSAEQMTKILAMIAPPKSIGRAKTMGIEQFDDQALKKYQAIMTSLETSQIPPNWINQAGQNSYNQ